MVCFLLATLVVVPGVDLRDQMRFSGCLLGCMVQFEKREGGAGEGAAPPLQCKQGLDSSFVLATQVFLGDRSGLLSIAACKPFFLRDHCGRLVACSFGGSAGVDLRHQMWFAGCLLGCMVQIEQREANKVQTEALFLQGSLF